MKKRLTEKEFGKIIYEEFVRLPEKFRSRINNVAMLVEDEPSDEVRALEGLTDDETLLGYYHGIPNTVRGEGYGIGPTFPDTITLFRLPILDEAEESGLSVRHVVRETLEHEIAHYFGMSEDEVGKREESRRKLRRFSL